uniref:ACB domain-containing protein n=1 Tax=Kalanchoe fedtschenkoi TaxID=63787 RepID=A0A7N0TFS2_KALFE
MQKMGMGEWQSLLQSIILGLIFSYLVAKLISIVLSFKDDNLAVTRRRDAHDLPLIPTEPAIPLNDRDDVFSRLSEHDSLMAEKGSVCSLGKDDDDDDDDWEGVESTELDEAFSAATAFVAAAAADRLSHKVSSDVQLQLYALYKIATEGPCSTPQPSALKITSRAKWQAWQKLGAMPPEDAMQRYIEIVTELYPTWLAGSTNKSRGMDKDSSAGDVKGPMGPVFSSFVYEEESGNDSSMDAIHGFAREGEVDKVLKCIESGVPVDLKDGEGRTSLHWAVDRGHQDVVELLLSKKADVNAKDNEGQTPLHYAATCEREAIAKTLIEHNAATNIKDSDGCIPADLCTLKWQWRAESSPKEQAS